MIKVFTFKTVNCTVSVIDLSKYCNVSGDCSKVNNTINFFEVGKWYFIYCSVAILTWHHMLNSGLRSYKWCNLVKHSIKFWQRQPDFHLLILYEEKHPHNITEPPPVLPVFCISIVLFMPNPPSVFVAKKLHFRLIWPQNPVPVKVPVLSKLI